MKKLLQSIGPAIVVAAVVLGPGSILMSSKVGAGFGLVGVPVIFGAAVLMIAMVILAGWLGVVYEGTVCDELSSRLGRPVAVLIGLSLFGIVAFFQSSNNRALIGGLEAITPIKNPILILILFNAFVIGCLYFMRSAYQSIERMMKCLIGLMAVIFLVNFVMVFLGPRGYQPVTPEGPGDWLPLLGMIGTTFSVGGAFYQAYLVREKGWKTADLGKGITDSIVSISVLGIVSCMILLTAWRIFYGREPAVTLGSVGDVARQMEPLFGAWARVVFAVGILAGALSSFLVNTLIGGTVLSDSFGKGARLSDRWPIHFTTVALLVGMLIAILGIQKEGSAVGFISLAQALTVLGIPALAATLVYLGTRKELAGEKRVPRVVLILAVVALLVSCVLAALTARKVYDKIKTKPEVALLIRSDAPVSERTQSIA